MPQIENAQRLKSLHQPSSPLVLYNIWDAGTAQAVERAGAKVVATSSWSVAAAQGYTDGEQLPLDDMLAIVGRIAKSVRVPLTVDFEGGYASAPEEVEHNVRRLLELGVMGFNFEDQIVDGAGLYSVQDQVLRIGAARRAAHAIGIPAFINARTDIFLKAEELTAHVDLVDEALFREKAYAAAGADGFFVPGLVDEALIRRVCATASLPVNIMTSVGAGDLGALAALGVSRISFGPDPFLSLMASVEQNARAML